MPSAVVFFAVDAACSSGSPLRSIWIWVQTKHEHCSQGIVSPSCKCTLSDGGGCSWYTPSEAWQNVQLNSCREITFVSRYTTFINYLSFIHLNYVCVYYRGREERSNAKKINTCTSYAWDRLQLIFASLCFILFLVIVFLIFVFSRHLWLACELSPSYVMSYT